MNPFNNFRFADDVVLLSKSGKYLQRMTVELHREFKDKCEVTMKKTMVMFCDPLLARQAII